MRPVAVSLLAAVLSLGCLELDPETITEPEDLLEDTGVATDSGMFPEVAVRESSVSDTADKSAKDSAPTDTAVWDSASMDTTVADSAAPDGPELCIPGIVSFVKGEIGPAGGVLQLTPGSALPFSISFAAGVLAAPSELKLYETSRPPPVGTVAASPVYQVASYAPTDAVATVTVAAPVGATGPVSLYYAPNDTAPFTLLPDVKVEGGALIVVTRAVGSFFTAATTTTPLGSLCP